MNKRSVYMISAAFILTSILSGIVGGAIVLAAWPFSDVKPGDWFYHDVKWLYDNQITTGYQDNTYRPNNNVNRAEMAAFLHRQAGAAVAAGVSVKRNASDHPYIADWFNNVNSAAPSISGSNGHYGIKLGFSAEGRFLQCTVNTYHSDTRDAVCTVNQFSGDEVWVRIYDISQGGLAPGEFWLLVYGN